MPWDSLGNIDTNKGSRPQPTTSAQQLPAANNAGRPPASTTTTESDHADIAYPKWFGGSASCFAVVLTHPLDLVKVQMQAAARGPKKLGAVATAVQVCKHDGAMGLYRGLTAGLARQFIYGSTRFALYDILKEALQKSDRGHDHASSQLGPLIAAASVSGFVAGIAGNPADLANVRMQSDSTLPPEQRRNYKNVFAAWRSMSQEPGGFFRNSMRGVWANSIRATIMTSSQLAAYDAFKDTLVTNAGMSGDSLLTHFAASTLAGLVATTLCSPVDVIKTQIMKASGQDAGKPIAGLVAENFKTQGIGWMFRGWVPSFTRLGPQTVAVFVILEQHRKLYRMWRGEAASS